MSWLELWLCFIATFLKGRSISPKFSKVICLVQASRQSKSNDSAEKGTSRFHEWDKGKQNAFSSIKNSSLLIRGWRNTCCSSWQMQWKFPCMSYMTSKQPVTIVAATNKSHLLASFQQNLETPYALWTDSHVRSTVPILTIIMGYQRDISKRQY